MFEDGQTEIGYEILYLYAFTFFNSGMLLLEQSTIKLNESHLLDDGKYMIWLLCKDRMYVIYMLMLLGTLRNPFDGNCLITFSINLVEYVMDHLQFKSQFIDLVIKTC